MRTASATDTTCHWTGVIVVAVAAPVTWKVVIDWITSAEGIAMHAEAASTCCRDQQGALRPMKWPCIYSANADKGKSDDEEEEEEPIHFPSGCSCADESVPRPWARDNIAGIAQRSALGQKQTSPDVRGHVRFTPESGHSSAQAYVRFVPKADISPRGNIRALSRVTRINQGRAIEGGTACIAHWKKNSLSTMRRQLTDRTG
jgi:hypothetical protein